MTETEKMAKTGAADVSTYELSYLMNHALDEAKLGEEVAKIRTVLEDSEANLFAEEAPRSLELGYPITVKGGGGSSQRAYFGWMKFDAKTPSLTVIRDALAANTLVMRSLVVHAARQQPAPKRRAPLSSATYTPRPAEEKKEPTMNEEELDKTIEDLVIE